jgi:hypothetical protein
MRPCGTVRNNELRTDTGKLRVLLADASLLEERNEWLVGGLDHQELERVTVEGNAFEGAKDRVEEGAASNYRSC